MREFTEHLPVRHIAQDVIRLTMKSGTGIGLGLIVAEASTQVYPAALEDPLQSLALHTVPGLLLLGARGIMSGIRNYREIAQRIGRIKDVEQAYQAWDALTNRFVQTPEHIQDTLAFTVNSGIVWALSQLPATLEAQALGWGGLAIAEIPAIIGARYMHNKNKSPIMLP